MVQPIARQGFRLVVVLPTPETSVAGSPGVARRVAPMSPVTQFIFDGTKWRNEVETSRSSASVRATGGGLALLGRSGLPWNSLCSGHPPIDPSAFETFRTRPVDGVVSFMSRNSWSTMQWAPARVAGSILHWSTPPFPDGSGITNAQIAAGTYDAQITAVARAWMAAGWNTNKTIIRPAWECNGDWFAWSWDKGGVANYIAMFRRWVTLCRNAGLTNILWDWNLNKGASAINANTVWTSAYPGDAYVDIVSLDPYDMWNPTYSDANWSGEINGRNPGLNVMATFCRSHGKQIGIPEWGLQHSSSAGGGGNDNPVYISHMLEWCKANVDILAYESYYDDPGGNPASQHWLSTGVNPKAAAQYRLLYPAGWGASATPTVQSPVVYVNESFTGSDGSTPGHLLAGFTPTGGGVSLRSNRVDFATGVAGNYHESGRVNRNVSQNGSTPLSVADVDVTLSVTYLGGEAYAELLARSNQSAWNGDTGYWLDFSNVFRIGKSVRYASTVLATGPHFTFTPGTQFKVRFRVVGSLLQAFVGVTLPSTPTVQVNDTSITAAGNVVLHVGTGGAATSSHVQFDSLLVTGG